MSRRRKDGNGPLWIIIVILVVALVAFVAIRFGDHNTRRTNNELYQWKLHWADRR